MVEVMTVSGWLQERLLKPCVNEDALAVAMREVCGQMQTVDLRFSEETDSDLLDACMYERLALQARYRYLSRLARRRAEGI